MNILICGDSYAADDERFPGVHWSHGIQAHGHKIWNLSSHGASNQFINLQVLQGINLKPDFVIFLGTNCYRFELYDPEENLNQYPTDLVSIRDFNRTQWISTSSIGDNIKRRNLFTSYIETFSHNMLVIQNYSYITNSLLALDYYKIPFCWQMGGFREELPTVKKTSAVDIFSKFDDRHIPLNLWDHYNPKTANDAKLPGFHILQKSVHRNFANHCINYINKV